MDAGQVYNEAFAQTTYGSGPTTVTSPPDSDTAPGHVVASLALNKTVDRVQFAAVGDTLTYRFEITNTGTQSLRRVTVSDPLLPGLSCQVAQLAPGAGTTCTGTLRVTQSQMDAGEIVNQASVAAISPQGGAVSAQSAPVRVRAPDQPSGLRLEKTASVATFGPVGSEIPYRFAVTNDGPFTLVNLRVTDPLVPGYSCDIARLAPQETDAASCVMRYRVTQADVDAGTRSNTASVTGQSLFGRVSTASDDLSLPGPARQPALSVLKLADVPATTLGSVVSYTVRVANSGNVTLGAPSLSDQMLMINTGRPTLLTTPLVYVSGDADGDGALDVGETWIYRATYRLTQAVINAAGVENTVRAQATSPDGSVVAALSDDGVSANGTQNPTLVPITADPVLDPRKVIATAGQAVGDEVIYRIELANRGNVDVSAITLSDQLTRRDGTDLSAQISGPQRVAPGVGDSVLAPGSFWAWEVRYTLTQADLDAGGLSNLAIAEGQAPDGTPVRVVSADGDDLDGNPADDPTELLIAPTPVLDVTKQLSSAVPTAADAELSFVVRAQNNGNVTLFGLTMADQMRSLAQDAITPGAITPDPTAPVDLPPNAHVDWVVTYRVTQDDVDAGGVQNSATVTAATPGGAPLSDLSDDADDSDGNAVDDPTVVPIVADPTLNVTKTASTPERVAGTTFRTTFTIAIENAGNVTHRELSLRDDLARFVAPARLVSVGPVEAEGFLSGGSTSDYDGVAQTQLLRADTALSPGVTGQVRFVVTYDVDAGSPGRPNVVQLSSDRTSEDVLAEAVLARAELAADILASKTVVTPGPYRAGGVVTYRITLTNRNSTAESGLSLVDELPPGMLYVADSARLDGAAREPVTEGRVLRWSGIDLAPGQSTTIDLSALLVEGAGRYVNRAFARDLRGDQVSNTAEATIEVSPEAVFDCSDVIGKVFDDLDLDGYQDPPRIGADGRETTTEPGLPGVKIVTLRGDIITTDDFGRFHVPCAALPGATGVNFTLKLDERSLPSGYLLTTENPRVMRLTAGIMTELNFGATLADAVDLTLTESAFAGVDPGAELLRAIDQVAGQMAGRPVLLRLTYLRGDEPADLAAQRLSALSAQITRRWPGPLQPRITSLIGRIAP